MSVPFIIILTTIIVLLISCIIILIIHIIKFREYVEKYNSIWSKFEQESIEKDIELLIQNMEQTKKVSEESKISSELVNEKFLKTLQKIGFIKYDAYEEGNNSLSFSLAILNAKDDGILLNSIYNRNGSNIYAKQIINGNYDGVLSKEEEKALQQAKNSKTYM